jgi:hypothetical protein
MASPRYTRSAATAPNLVEVTQLRIDRQARRSANLILFQSFAEQYSSLP